MKKRGDLETFSIILLVLLGDCLGACTGQVMGTGPECTVGDVPYPCDGPHDYAVRQVSANGEVACVAEPDPSAAPAALPCISETACQVFFADGGSRIGTCR